jgi:diacylglycerol kinase family enzyme
MAKPSTIDNAAIQQPPFSICRCCGQALFGHEVYIGVCTDCVQDVASTNRIEIGQVAYGSNTNTR